MYKNGLIRKIMLILKIMTSQPIAMQQMLTNNCNAHIYQYLKK